MKAKILALLLKYRTDFSTPEMSLNNYADYGISEESFDDLANDLDNLMNDRSSPFEDGLVTPPEDTDEY